MAPKDDFDKEDVDIIDATTIYSFMISRYFTPEDFDKDGYMRFISLPQGSYTLSS